MPVKTNSETLVIIIQSPSILSIKGIISPTLTFKPLYNSTNTGRPYFLVIALGRYMKQSNRISRIPSHYSQVGDSLVRDPLKKSPLASR